MCPGRAIWEYCFVPPATVGWVQSHWHDLETLLSWDQLRENRFIDSLFARQPANILLPTMLPRAGYVFRVLESQGILANLEQTGQEYSRVTLGATLVEVVAHPACLALRRNVVHTQPLGQGSICNGIDCLARRQQ